MDRPSIDLRLIFETSVTVLSIVGLILNILLLYLILFKTAKIFSDYKIILLQNCLVDVLFNFVNEIVKGQTDYKDGSFYLIASDWVKNIPYPYNCIFILIWGFALFCCVTTIPAQFVYRYFVIVKERQMTPFEYWLLLSTAIFGSLIYTICNTYVCWPNSETFEAKAALLLADPYYFRGVPMFMVAEIQKWPLRISCAIGYVIVMISYTAAIWSFYKVWKKMKSQAVHFSADTKRMHDQMTKTMVLQAHIPVIFIQIPIGIAITATFAQINVPGLGIIANLLCCWIPVANPLVTIISVKPYRQVIITFFKRYILKHQNQEGSGNSWTNSL